MQSIELFKASLATYKQAFDRRLVGVQGKEPAEKAARTKAAWVAIVERLDLNAADWAKREGEIMRNTRLSNEGKQTAKAELGKAAISDVKWLGDKLIDAEAAAARYKALLFGYMTRPKGDAGEQYARELEVRNGLRSASQVDKDAAFHRAAERLDGEFMRALQNGPGGPWISGEILSRAETAFAQRQNPEVYQQWRDVEVLIEHLRGIAEHGARVLLGLTMGQERLAILKTLGLPDVEEKGPAHA